MKILVATEPADFRRGIDGLASLCRSVLESDPFSGTVFVFRNRSAKAVKILVYDSQGFWLCTKRLSTGRFRWWPQTTGQSGKRLEAHQLQLLLWNGDPERAGAQPAWRRVCPGG
ncbi:MAG: IS66 family insertion sequence element accessory protein TnpB, partial [Deltaproteobacteria bacterium]|nr:IS66 family insertion sequence element accessory protein TnpB [Deltaproteobacteria bacterium]